MIPIKPAPEPADFDAKVRKEGKRFLRAAKLRPPVPDEKWDNRRFWRPAIPDLYQAYGGFCAFISFRIHSVTGWKTVEHYQPKGKHPRLAYEWSNLRLVCGLMNGRKGDNEDVLDPFTLPAFTFDLNSVSGEILLHGKCPRTVQARAASTIERLKLNDASCCAQRVEDAQAILSGKWTREEGFATNPFVARCLEAQGLL